jgi:hypothetical protein
MGQTKQNLQLHIVRHGMCCLVCTSCCCSTWNRTFEVGCLEPIEFLGPDACKPINVMPMPARLMLVFRTRFCTRKLRLTTFPSLIACQMAGSKQLHSIQAQGPCSVQTTKSNC